jgi:phosphatidylglycerophosphatase A
MKTPAETSSITRIALHTPAGLLAFGFGSGLAPVAPGTFGTLAAIPFYLLLAQLPGWAYLLAVGIAFALGVIVCDITARRLGVHDFGGIVWDEFVGLWIALAGQPLHWQVILAGFVLFRLFDILKPWPIGYLDKKVGGGLGIMLDDVIAGVYAWLALKALVHFGLLGAMA